MPNSSGTVVVTTTDKQESYVLNGTMNTVKDAVDKFFGGADEVFDQNDVSLNGNKITEHDTSTELRPNDVILVLSKNLAAGGVKGAN